MKTKFLIGAIALSSLLVACNDEKQAETIVNSENGNTQKTTETVQNNEATLGIDNNKVYGQGSTVSSITLFTESENYPEDLSKSRYSREVRDLQIEDGGWYLSGYDDNHSIFISQDNDNEFKLTTKHGLLIFDDDINYPHNEKKWTNHYFKGIYFNEETNKFELKFVIDSKQKDELLSVGVNFLRFNGYDVPQSLVSFDYYNTVRPDEVQLFTVYVDKTDDYPLEIDTISFNYEIYTYNLDFKQGDEIDDSFKEIYMELSR